MAFAPGSMLFGDRGIPGSSAAAESETGSCWAPSRNDGPSGSHGSASEEVTATPDLELKLPARAENVAVVRHAFGGFAEVLTVDEQTLADIKLAVTEACTNAVVHAYPDGEGPLEVAAYVRDSRLLLVVRDQGRGIVPRTDSPGLGLGLPLIATLAEALELGTDDADHTEVRMTFRLGADEVAA
jgi:serine/threonine-protein kinase RsbW